MQENVVKNILDKWIKSNNWKYKKEFGITVKDKNFECDYWRIIDFMVKIEDFQIFIECKGINNNKSRTLIQLDNYINTLRKSNKTEFIFLAVPKEIAEDWKNIMLYFDKFIGVISIDINNTKIIYDPLEVFKKEM